MDYRQFQKQVDFLLDNASPNIQYRVKKEILGEAIETSEMMELQAKILALPKVKKAFAWFMKGLSAVSNHYPIFEDNNPHFSESLIEIISDENFIDNIGEEQLRHFKNYSSLAPSWRKRESITCDIYFPILLALSIKV